MTSASHATKIILQDISFLSETFFFSYYHPRWSSHFGSGSNEYYLSYKKKLYAKNYCEFHKPWLELAGSIPNIFVRTIWCCLLHGFCQPLTFFKAVYM